MHAMQYEMTLPADYDMAAFRARIAGVSSVYDDLDGLGLKAYMFRERGRDGSPVNQYALFYLWHDPAAMNRFLVGGGGFERIVAGFGRLSVDHWTVLATVSGPDRAAAPAAASRRLAALPADPDPDGTGLGLAARIEREVADLEALRDRPGVHTAALALDPRDWRLVRFVLWSDAVPADEAPTERYDVPHVSMPGLATLPRGRHW